MTKKWIPLAAVLLLLTSGVALADREGFVDVSPTYWAAGAIAGLEKLGIVQGYGDDTFKPESGVTRAEVAQMIYNEHQSMEKELKAVQTADNAVTTAIANALPGVVVIDAGNKLGAGFFIDAGHILTAEHVVDGEDSIQITTLSGHSYAAKVQAADMDKDLALLRVTTGNEQVKPLSFANSYTVGETAIAIGHPDGLAYSVSKGIISNSDRSLDGIAAKMIQVDTAISPGNSGGPLLDIGGNIIGIVDSKINAKASEGLGFAVSLEDIQSFLKQYGL
ncbi:trypsin-like peptidase domain-containing protein [Gordoniibacillus kamchatkensis]|uniref:trypsin-like peptidase domain-containing protein n=1 Tax=Gordoniibacillus kamchatkensis TaxID=1590651 RepID=UPI000697A32E|nr:trypsin-like peptidase domain-containing protein [Paenibacillus sp. VKM B-2647]